MDEKASSSGGLTILSVAHIPSRQRDWIWPSVMPIGEVIVLGGDTEMLKSSLICDFAATMSTGGSFPDGTQSPILTSLIVSFEESGERAIKPRLESSGADMEKIYVLDERSTVGTGVGYHLDLHEHLQQIEQVITQHDINVIFFDPISAYLGKRGWGNGPATRTLLVEMVRLAERCNVTIVLIVHTKAGDGGTKALERLLIGADVTQMIRVVWMIGPVPTDERHDADTLGPRRVFEVIKNNFAIKPPAREVSRPMDERLRWYETSIYSLDGLATRPKEYQLSRERMDILDLIDWFNRPVESKDVEARLKMKPTNVRRLFHVMERAGQLVRVAQGFYDDAAKRTYPDSAGNSAHTVTGNRSRGLPTGGEMRQFIEAHQRPLNERYDLGNEFNNQPLDVASRDLDSSGEETVGAA